MAGDGALPNLIVIGAQKCGTTALHAYLGRHPEIAMSRPKELDFFVAEGAWSRGPEWYSAQFRADAPIRGEASPNYTAHPVVSGAAERMHSLVPEARLIYIVRDPIERIAAQWMHDRAAGDAGEGLADSILDPRAGYVARSSYCAQLERYLGLYPRDRVLVLDQEDLRRSRSVTMRSAYEFLGVEPSLAEGALGREYHRSRRKARPTWLGRGLEQVRRRGGKRVIPLSAWSFLRGVWPFGRRIHPPDVGSALTDEIVAALRADAERFAELTGRRYEHWSIWRM